MARRGAGISASETAAIGDAENDIGLNSTYSLPGAASNALPTMKAVADYVYGESYGKGIREFIEYLRPMI